MKIVRGPRLGAAFLLVAALATLGNSLRRRTVSKRPRTARVHSGLTTEQIQHLRAVLPPRTGVLSDAPETPVLSLNPLFYWMQYELAPIVLVLPDKAKVVLLRLNDERNGPTFARERGLVIREDLGGGVFVLERPGP
jgi:hypothetical protein